jgi:RNA polymerase sigma-70 factor, ECF subfamily
MRDVQATQDGGEPDDDLLERVAAGDDVALQQLYRRLSPPAYGLALRVLRDEHLAQDAVQEAFLQVWRDAGRFDPQRSSARGWVLTLVHRRAVDRVRREDLQRRNAGLLALHREEGPDHVAEVVQLRAEQRAVRTAMGHLTTLQRQALEMAYFEGKTQTQIAGELDIPLGTAKTRIRDAVIAMRQRLEVDR